MRIESKEIGKLAFTPTPADIVNSADYIYTQTNSIRVACDRIGKAINRPTEASQLSGIQKELGYLKEHVDKLVSGCNEIFTMFEILDTE